MAEMALWHFLSPSVKKPAVIIFYVLGHLLLEPNHKKTIVALGEVHGLWPQSPQETQSLWPPAPVSSQPTSSTHLAVSKCATLKVHPLALVNLVQLMPLI